MPAKKPGKEWRSAPEVGAVAHELIARVMQHQPLIDVHVEYVFINEAPTSRGREIWGRARKISGLNAWLSHPDQPRSGFVKAFDYFVIEISHDVWERLDDGGRTALVDHELCHCIVDHDDDGEIVLKMRSHDVEEFIGVLVRNGLWAPDVRELARVAAEQLSIRFDDQSVTSELVGADA
jgi:hypothetical protein